MKSIAGDASIPAKFLAPFGGGKRTEPHTRTVIVEELDAGLLQRRLNLREGRGARADFAAKGFHAADGADGHA